jgi:GDP-mannose 6-dehydrogenase
VKVSVFGLGYVGAVSCGCLPELGHAVVGVDNNPSKVKMINDGLSPVVEEGIDDLITAAVRAGQLRATDDVESAVMDSEVSLISVATPSRSNYMPDLTAVEEVVRAIGAVLRNKPGAHALVLRSTVPPGTTEDRLLPILQESAGRNVGDRLSLVFNPEFLREGSSVKDFRRPPQTVVGSLDEAGYAVMQRLYGSLPGPVVQTTCRIAESVKYLCNVFHALKIVFANETGSVLKASGVDAVEVMRIFCQDTHLNISAAYLRPGYAFGGSCLPKEVKGFLALARNAEVPVPMLGGLLDSNSAHIDRAFAMVAAHGRRRVALFGLAFKPGTDDLRDSPFVSLAERLIGRGFDITIFDPFVRISRLLGKNKEYIDREVPHLDRLLKQTAEQALEGAQTIVVGHADAATRKAIAQHASGREIIDLAGYEELGQCGAASYDGICW